VTTERGTVAPPTTFDELVARINDRFAGLSPSHQMLAELVLGDPERLAFMTGDELAAETRVSESTVDRFATEMGLDGFTTVVGLCRAKLQEGGQLLRRLSHLERLDTSLSEDHPLTLALVSEQANITRTLGRVDPATWDRAVETFSRVPRVFMFGIGKCSMVAAHFSLLLRLVRDEVYALQPSPSPLIDDLRRIQPGRRDRRRSG
jgi:DNA-binding MurR/RpiR family transcriptional regulator